MARLPAQNLHGQRLGAKGMRTRLQIMKAVEQLIEKRTLRELTVAEITQIASTGASTFYAYFGEVSEAVLAVVREGSEPPEDLRALFERPWTRDDAFDNARLMIAAYCAYWDRRFHILRLRNLAADEGDKRFAKARHEANASLFQALVRRFEAAQPDTDALSLAVVSMAMLDRIPVITRGAQPSRTSRQRLIVAAAHALTAMVEGAARGVAAG
jgi:AcrR family transcriptional regulator